MRRDLEANRGLSVDFNQGAVAGDLDFNFLAVGLLALGFVNHNAAALGFLFNLSEGDAGHVGSERILDDGRAFGEPQGRFLFAAGNGKKQTRHESEENRADLDG